ncbi:uncharacterized protein LOC131613188 [Vicia villosa]|uniref:uncharacterized protein LOC131613188 n=1 Tax=Vicia villosa TaxID=3911 RepID=UPI00273A8621|nr:uncharacterized protein LOC131613188 [Vicia villosa]
MLESVEIYGPHLKPPSFHEMRVSLPQNELEYTKMGTMFVKGVDASNYAKTRDKLAELLDTFDEEIGDKNVVQLITNNGSNYVMAGKILTLNRPNMFWTPCVAQCIDLMLDLMLEDIRKIPRVHKKWSDKSSKDPKGKRTTSIILMPSFLNDVVYTLKVMAPLVDVLRMDGYYLNSKYFYNKLEIENDPKLVRGLRKCIETLCGSHEVEVMILVQLTKYKGVTGLFDNFLPASEWWKPYGVETPDL